MTDADLLALPVVPEIKTEITEDESVSVRTQSRINRIVELRHLRENLDLSNRDLVLFSIEEHEKARLYALADRLRLMAGLPVQHPQNKTRLNKRKEQNAVRNHIKELLLRNTRMKPDEIAALINEPRYHLDRMLNRMRKNGEIVLIAKRYFALPGTEED